MFESLLSNFLSSRLTQFVKHIDTENLKVGIWKGEVVLEDLELRSDCFEGLDAPFFLRGGYIGNLRIKIPWNSLTSKPVIIELEKIHLILHPLEGTTNKHDANYAALSKQASIAAAELAKRANVHASTNWRSNLLSRLLTRIIGSIQIRILDIHARVEIGSGIIGATSFAAGALIQEVSSSTGSFAEKIFQVKGLAAYWDRDVEPISCTEMNIGDLTALFTDWGCNVEESSASSSVHEDDDGDIFFVARSEDEGSAHQFVLHPLDLSLALRVLTPSAPEASTEAEKPKYEADVAMKTVRVSLEVGQMWDMLRLADWLQVSELRKSFGSLRPDTKICQSPLMWWRYAISAVICQTKAKSSTWSWSELKTLCANRREYSRLYRLMLSGKASSLERLQLASLEGQLPVEQIMFSRAIAEDQIGKAQMQSSGERSWFRWGLRRVMSPQTGGQGDVEDVEVEFTREEEDFLSNALEIPEHASGLEKLSAGVPSVSVPRDVPADISCAQLNDTPSGRPNPDLNAATTRWSQRKKSRRLGKVHGVSCEIARNLAITWFDRPRNPNSVLAIADISLSELTITLAVRLQDNGNENLTCNFYNIQEIITASLSEISLRVNSGTEETKVTAKICQFSVRDMLTQRSAFPFLISSEFPAILKDDAQSSILGKTPSVSSQHPPAVDTEIFIRGDTTSIQVKIQPLEIVALPECLYALGAYFIPEYEAPFYENQVISALNSIGDCAGRIQAKLAFLVEKMSHQVTFEVHAEKPRIIIPGDVLCADTAMIFCVDTLMIESSPYGWHEATQRAISAAAKELESCAEACERQKQMQRMFFAELALNLSGVRLFIAEAVPAANFSFIAYRLANALKAKGNSKGISPSNPQFSKTSNDVLLPMDLHISVLLSLLRSDASMPLVYLKTHIMNLKFKSDLNFLARALSVLQRCNHVSPQYLDLRQRIKEQACRANMGKPCCQSTVRDQIVRRKEGLPTAAAAGIAEIQSDGSKEDADNSVVGKDDIQTSSARNFKNHASPQPVDSDSIRQMSEAASGDANGHFPALQEATTQMQLADTERQIGAGSIRADEVKKSRWWVRRWLNAGSRDQQTVAARTPENPSSSSSEVQGFATSLVPQSPHQGNEPSRVSNVKQITKSENPKVDKISDDIVKEGCKNSNSIPLLPSTGLFKTGKVNEALVDSTQEQQSCARSLDSIDMMKSEKKGGAPPNRRWFQWSSPAEPSQEALDPSGKSAEQSNTLESKERPGSSLLNRLKFLYPVVLQGAMQEPETTGETDNLSRQRVMSLPASTKTDAFLLVESRGQRWEALSWKEKLRACLEAGDTDANRPSESRCTSPDLPRLRERFSSSFIAANLDEISPRDAVHLEAELCIYNTSFLIFENQNENDTALDTLHGQTMGVGLQLLPSTQALQTSSFSAGVVLRRHGVNFQSKVDDLVLCCGAIERVEAFSADSCIISSRESGPENVLKLHSGPWASIDALKTIENGPFLQSKVSYFEDGYTLQDGIRLGMSYHLRSLAAKFGRAEYKCIYSLANQFSSILEFGQSAADVHAPTNESGIEKSKIIPSKLFLTLGIASMAMEDALSQHNWSKLTIRGLQCVLDSGHCAEKLAEISLGFFGVYSSQSVNESWETVLSPESDACCKSIRAFHLALQRKDENRARLESYRKSSKALELQQAIRCVPNLIQDQKLNLRSQLQDRKIDFRTQKRCVSGNSVVSFLVDHGFAHDREEGIKLGQLLIDQGLMHKVPDHGKFEDCSALYRFFIDEEEINVRSIPTECHPDVIPKDVTKDHFFLSATIMAVRINVYHSFCDTVLHTISIIDKFHSQNKPSSFQRLEDTKTLPEANLKQKLTGLLETLDVHLFSAGLSCHIPALKGNYSILGCYKEISLISNYYNCWDEHAREETTTLRPGLDASSRSTGTSSFDTFAWTGSQAHKFCFKISGFMLTGQGKRSERLIDSFDLQIEMSTRPNGIVTVDTTISPGLRVSLDEDFLTNLADVLNHAREASAKPSGPHVTKSMNPDFVFIQSFFSGGYGFKLDCGGLDLTLPCYPVDDRFRLMVKPLCCTLQVLFKDSALLPLDIIKSRAAFRLREAGGGRDCGLVRLILDSVATVDLGVLVDDLVVDTVDVVLFRGQSASVRTCLASPSVGLESQDQPESGRRASGAGDDWRLLRVAAVWRPGASGGDVALDCRVGGFLLRHDSAAASPLICRISWFSALLCDQSSVDAKRRPQTRCGPGPEPAGSSRDQLGPLVRGQGLPKAQACFGGRGSGRAAQAHSGSASHGAEASPSKLGGCARGPAEAKAGARCGADSWADLVPGRCELRLSTGEWQLLSAPQRICGSTPQYLCLASRFAIHTVAENSSEGAGQARRLTTDLEMGVALCWCNVTGAGGLPYPATAGPSLPYPATAGPGLPYPATAGPGLPYPATRIPGPCLVPSHMLFHLPTIAFHMLLAGPGAGWDWTSVLRDGGGMKATVECEVGSVVEARGSFADLAGIEAALLDAMAALAPLTESRDSRASDGPAGARALAGEQRATSPRARAGQAGTPDEAREARAGADGRESGGGGEHRAGALVVASMLSCLSVRVAGVRLVLAECRRAGPAGGTLRLPLLDLSVSGVEGRLEAAERMGVRCCAAGYASCDYLNRGLGQWEPLLERWGCDATAKTDVALDDLVRGARSRVDVEVASGDHLNVNVSRAMLDVAMGVLAKDAKQWRTAPASPGAGPAKLSLLNECAEIEKQGVAGGGKETRDKEADPDERAGDGDAFHPLWIKNETGQRILLEAHPLPVAAPLAVLEQPPPCSPTTCPSPPMAVAPQPRHPGPGGAWQQVEAGGMHPVTCVPLVSAPATGAGPGLPQVSLRLLRVYLAHPELASAAGAGNGPADIADAAPWPTWDEPAPDAIPPASRPPSSSPGRAAGDHGGRGPDTSRMLHGCIDLDLPGRQVLCLFAPRDPRGSAAAGPGEPGPPPLSPIAAAATGGSAGAAVGGCGGAVGVGGAGAGAGDAVKLLVEVGVGDGGASKVVTVRSPLVLRNLLARPVQVMFNTVLGDCSGPDEPAPAGRARCRVAPGAALVVPVGYLGAAAGFAIRPEPGPGPSGTADALPMMRSRGHPGYRWVGGHALSPSEWTAGADVATFKALSGTGWDGPAWRPGPGTGWDGPGTDMTALLHWHVASPADGARSDGSIDGLTVCTASLRPALVVENLLPCPLVYLVKSCSGPDPPPRPHVPAVHDVLECGAGGPRARLAGGAVQEPPGGGGRVLASGAQEHVYDVDVGEGRSVWVCVGVPAQGFPAWSSWAVLRAPPPPDTDPDPRAPHLASRGARPDRLGWAVTDRRAAPLGDGKGDDADRRRVLKLVRGPDSASARPASGVWSDSDVGPVGSGAAAAGQTESCAAAGSGGGRAGCGQRVLEVEAEVLVDECGTCRAALFAPWWLVNRLPMEARLRDAGPAGPWESEPGDVAGVCVRAAASPLVAVRDPLLDPPDGPARRPGGPPAHEALEVLRGSAPDAAARRDAGGPGCDAHIFTAASEEWGPALATSAGPDEWAPDSDGAAAAWPWTRDAGAWDRAGLSEAVGLEVLALDAGRALSPRASLPWHDPGGLGQRAVEPFSVGAGWGEEREGAGEGAGAQLQLQLEGTAWSRPFRLAQSGPPTGDGDGGWEVALRLADAPGRAGFRLHRYVEVGVCVRLARGIFHRTRTVTLSPRYLLLNRTGLTLLVRQDGGLSMQRVPASCDGQCVAWHWPDSSSRQRRLVRFGLDDSDGADALEGAAGGVWQQGWSGCVGLGRAGDAAVMIEPRSGRPGPVTLDVSVRQVLGSMLCVISRREPGRPPYVLENLSSSALRVYQAGSPKPVKLVRPYQCVPYAWDVPPARGEAGGGGGANVLAVEVEGSSPLVCGHYALDRVGEHRPMGLSRAGGPLFTARVRCDGPTLVLSIVNAGLHPAPAAPLRPAPLPSPPVPRWPSLHAPYAGAAQHAARAGSPALRPSHPAQPGPAPGRPEPVSRSVVRGGCGMWSGSVTVRLAGIGVSLIDSDTPRELLYIWLGADVHGQEGGAGAGAGTGTEAMQAGRGGGAYVRLPGADGADGAGGGHGGADGPGGAGAPDGAARGSGRGLARGFKAGDGVGAALRGGGRAGRGGLLVHVWRQAASDGGGPGEEGLHVGLRRIQVDNMAGDGSCPVLLRMACEARPAGPSRSSDAEDWWGACGAPGWADADEDMVRLRVVREGCAAPRRHEVLALKTVAVHCRELRASLDEALVLALLEVGDRLAGSVGRASRRVSARLAASKEWRVAAMAGRLQEGRAGGLEDRDLAAAAAALPGCGAGSGGTGWPGWTGPGRVYVHDLSVSRVVVHLSYRPAVQALDVQSLLSAAHLLASSRFFFQHLDQVPVLLGGLRLSNCLGTPAALAGLVGEHYRMQGVLVVSRIVGSMPNLGNPLGLLSSVGVGVLDLVRMPAQALRVGRMQRRGRAGSSRGAAAVALLAGDVSSVLRGLVRGCGSLVWHTVRGCCTTLSLASGSGARFLAFVSMDEAFAADITRAAGDRLAPDLVGVVPGILVGIAGLARLPVQGWVLGWNSPRRALRLAPRPAPAPAPSADSADRGDMLAAGDVLESHRPEGAARGPSLEGVDGLAAEDGVVVWERACGGAAGLLQAALSAVAALVAKPLAALLDRLAATSAAVAAGGTAAARPRRVRPPRVLAPNRPLPPLPQPHSSVLHPL